MPKLRISGLLFALSILFLASCESSESRAEKHFEAALQFLEEGDTPRAIIEFKNVFKYNGKHEEARQRYARLQRSRGNGSEAYSQYLRLVEEHPQNLEGRIALAEMALENRQWKEVERHVTAAAELEPDNTLVRSVMANLDYYTAAIEKRPSGMEAAIIRATQLIKLEPELISAQRLVISDLIRQQRWDAALETINTAFAATPSATDLNPLKLGVLVKLGDTAAIEQHLLTTLDSDPGNQEKLTQLVTWYVSQDQNDKAETFLRDLVKVSDQPHMAQLDLVKFISQTRGVDQAKAELLKLVDEYPDQKFLFSAVKATLDYQTGAQEAAITDLEALLKDEPVSEQTDNFKIALSRMLAEQNNPVGARALVEEVIARNPNHLGAVESKADWLIKDDETTDAIAMLRGALGQNPNKASLLSLMAQAHQREGNRDLMAEMLSLAVEASGSAPEESLRYAALLIGTDKSGPAETVLLNSLRVNPNNLALLSQLTTLYSADEDWGSASDMIERIKAVGTPQANAMANELTTSTLAAQDRDQELLAYLGGLSSGNTQVDLAIIQSYLRQNNIDQALNHIAELESKGDNLSLWKFVKAKIFAAENRNEDALVLLNGLLADGQNQMNVFVEIFKIHSKTGNGEQATIILDQAIAEYPDAQNLKWFKASDLEARQDFDGAIAIYEDLYEINSASPLIANNLASLLTTHRDDQASLDRAYKIARRFKDTDSAPAQDTYGWIAYRLGNYAEALTPLQSARNALPDNPDIAFHLGMTHAALENTTEALTHLNAALDLADKNNPPSYIDQVSAEIERLNAAQ